MKVLALALLASAILTVPVAAEEITSCSKSVGKTMRCVTRNHGTERCITTCTPSVGGSQRCTTKCTNG